MLWLGLSLTSAFAGATSDALTKRFFGHLNAYEAGLVRLLYGLPFLALLLVRQPWPQMTSGFWIIVAVLYPLEAVALAIYMRAIRVSPLSLTLPFLAFTPVFLVGTGFIFLGEVPNVWGAAGILLVLLGSYVLNLKASRTGLLEPIKAVFREEGSWLMLAVAAIYSITSALGKVAIQITGPAFFGAFYPALLAILLGALYPAIGLASPKQLVRKPGLCLILGAVYAAMFLAHAAAINLVNAAYMISVKRLSLLFGVLYGWLLFREADISERIGGAGLMVAGVVLITLYG